MQPHIQMASPVNSRDLADVDAVLDQAIIAGNPLIATDHGNTISNTIRLKGVALAKLFFGLRNNWTIFRAAGIQDDFVDFVEANMTIRGNTANKYADMYASVLANDQIPAYIRERLQFKPIQTLLLLTAAVREGDLDASDLEDAVVLSHNGVHALVRNARGDATNSKTAVRGRLVSQEGRSYPPGTIVVYGVSSDGRVEIEAVGGINLKAKTESGRKYVDKMKRKLGLEELSYEDVYKDLDI